MASADHQNCATVKYGAYKKYGVKGNDKRSHFVDVDLQACTSSSACLL